MVMLKENKYAFAGLILSVVSFLLLALFGCNASSDPKQYYQATGSWQGTIGADRVRGIIAPDGRYQLAIVDADGNFIPGAGEYIGSVWLVDEENNIGKMTMVFLHPPDNARAEPQISCKLDSKSLYSEEASIVLNRSNEATPGSYVQAEVAGRWSLSFAETDKLTAAVVDADGNLSGHDDVACSYSGTLKLLDSAWNIFQLDLTFRNLPGQDCSADVYPNVYRGLTMTLSPENSRRRLWIAANSWEITQNKTGTYFGDWAETINIAPVAAMTANTIELVETVVQTLKVKKLIGMVKLDAQGSSDENKDPLTYQWRGTDPNGVALIFQPTAEGVVTFTPEREGRFTFWLKVNDGLLDSVEIERTILVEWVVDRFVDCANGTVLDTSTNLFWLKDAGCPDLHDVNNWWVDFDKAKTSVSQLASGGCGLTDGSVVTNWRLPLKAEFEKIIAKDENSLPLYLNPPALVNGVGDAQWTDGDIFINVGKHPFASYKVWIFWTSEPIVVEASVPYATIVDFAGAQAPYPGDPWSPWFAKWITSNINSVWPARNEISTVAGDEVNACLQQAPQ